jgi:endoglucanase
MQTPSEQRNHFLAIWHQLAEHYQDIPEELYFELLNEPSTNIDATYWNELVDESISIIRRTNPNRKIIIGGINYSTIESLYLLNLPKDDNLIATFHFYEPFEFTHQGASWVAGSSNWLGRTWDGTLAEKHHIRALFDQAAEWSKYHKIPILMGEFGVIQTAEPVSKKNWVDFVVRQAEKREINWSFWSLCSNFAIYDCQEMKWDEQMLEALIK